MSIKRLLNRLTQLKSASAHPLPRLLVLSDCARGYGIGRQQDIWSQEISSHNVCFIERTFGQLPTAVTQTKKPLMQLATCSPKQARQIGLNGLHWPQARLRLRRRSQIEGLLETASAHNGREIAKAQRLGIACILISPAFSSNSPSAERALGPHRLARLARMFPHCFLFALGGITQKTAARLKGTGIYGAALVSFTAKKSRKV
jgi:Thiamine monophosphate synthase